MRNNDELARRVAERLDYQILWDALVSSEQRVEELEEALPKWIPVGERLSPRHQNVLCFNRDGSIFEGRICMGMHQPFFTYPRGDGSASNTAPSWIDVTHWMPLPKPPEAALSPKEE